MSPRRASNSPFTSALLTRVWEYFERDVWLVELSALPLHKAAFYKALRVIYLTLRGFVVGKSFMRASALTYITVLGIVPLLALAFSVAKAIGVYEKYLKPEIQEMFAGEARNEGLLEAINKVFEVVENTDVRALGLPALGLVLLAVLKLLGTVEGSLNDIWGVHKARSFVRRFADYLAMLIIVPVFVALAVAVTSAGQVTAVINFLEKSLGLGWLLEALSGLTSTVVMWGAFTFMYVALPNTRARFFSSMLGGLLAALLWQLAFTWSIRFTGYVGRYNEIYGIFALLIIFLAFTHTSWVIVLLGAELAFAHQSEPAYRQIARTRQSDHAFREIVALRAIVRVALAFLRGEDPLTAATVAARIGVPPRQVEEVFTPLAERGLVAIVETFEGNAFVPARDLEKITIKSVLDALKGTSGPVDVPAQDAVDEELDRLLVQLDREMDTSPQNKNLRELAREAGRTVESVETTVEHGTEPRQA